MGEVETGLEPVVVEPVPEPAPPVPMGPLADRVVAVPLDHTGALVGTTGEPVLVVVHEVEVVVVRGLVTVQGQSVMVRVVA